MLVLDEPFSGLDPVAVEMLSKVLVGEARRGATVLFSSHQLDLVEHVCERAVVVDRGRVVADGTIDDLTAGAAPVLDVEVPSDQEGSWAVGLPGVDVIRAGGGRVRLALAHGAASTTEQAQPVLDAARRAGPVSHFAFDRRSLAEVFLTTVGRPVEEARSGVAVAGAGIDPTPADEVDSGRATTALVTNIFLFLMIQTYGGWVLTAVTREKARGSSRCCCPSSPRGSCSSGSWWVWAWWRSSTRPCWRRSRWWPPA